MSDSYYIHTFGCQMNKHDSERLGGVLETYGYRGVDDIKQADIILVNTCYVREKAMVKVYGFVGKLKLLKKQNPDLIIAVCGCGAQGEGEKILQKMSWVDLVVGPQHGFEIGELVEETRRRKQQIAAFDKHGDRKLPDVTTPIKREDSLKAWVTIMEGCDNFCSYCVVPYVRGRERSRSASDIIEEVHRLHELGYREITLLGQNVNSYQDPHTTHLRFPELLARISEETQMQRIRFVTSHPKDLSFALIDVIASYEPVCEYLHLPVQSGADTILAKMNRGYTAKQYRSLIENIRCKIPEVSLSTDIIVGFPGEGEKEFLETKDLLAWVEYDTAFVFHYQIRSGTKAATYEDSVPLQEKLERLQILVALQNHITERHHAALVGQEVEILVEGPSKRGEGTMTGRTRGNHIIHYPGDSNDRGTILRVKITDSLKHSLRGERISS